MDVYVLGTLQTPLLLTAVSAIVLDCTMPGNPDLYFRASLSKLRLSFETVGFGHLENSFNLTISFIIFGYPSTVERKFISCLCLYH